MDVLTLLTGWLPPWAAHLVVALDLVAMMAFAGFASVRMGKSPLWVLGLLVPFVNVAVIWYLAYSHWPRTDGGEGGR